MVYPPFLGLPTIPPNVADALQGFGDVSVPDVNFGANIPENQLQKVWDSILEGFNPSVVSKEEMAELEQAKEDNPEQAASIDATLQAATMANMFASPAARVCILFWAVTILIAIIRKIPGVRGVPSLSGMLSAMATGGFSFTMDGTIVSGWAVLPWGYQTGTGTWDGHSISSQKFMNAGEPRHAQWPIPIFPGRNSEDQGNYYLKTCYGEMKIGPDAKVYEWNYDSNPYNPTESKFAPEYFDQQGNKKNASGRQMQITITGTSGNASNFNCTKYETGTKGNIATLTSKNLNEVSTADGNLALPKDKIHVQSATFSGQIMNAYDLPYLSADKGTGNAPISWCATHGRMMLDDYLSHDPTYLFVAAEDGIVYRFRFCKIHFEGLHRKDKKTGADYFLGADTTDTVNYTADKVWIYGFVEYDSTLSVSSSKVVAHVVIEDKDGNGTLRLRSTKKDLTSSSSNADRIVWVDNDGNDDAYYEWSISSATSSAYVDICTYDNESSVTRSDIATEMMEDHNKANLPAFTPSSHPEHSTCTRQRITTAKVFRFNQTSAEGNDVYLNKNGGSDNNDGFGVVDKFTMVRLRDGQTWASGNYDYIDLNIAMKPYIALWGAGSLVTKESVDFQGGFKIPAAPTVALQDTPSFGYEVLKPCTYPPSGMNAKMQMLVNEDADRFTVMATFGCCFTEEVWERFVELKKMAKADRHFVRW